MTRLKNVYGNPKSSLGAIEIKALIKIPAPPDPYVEMKCALGGLEGGVLEEARKKFYKRLSDFAGAIQEYIDNLIRIRNHNIAFAEYALATNKVAYTSDNMFEECFDPIERIVEKERFQWVPLVDFNFMRIDKQLKRRKIFTRLYPERFCEK